METKKDEKEENDNWIKDLNKKILEFFIDATPENVRNLLKKSNYEGYTGINPDILEIRELATDEIQQMREEYNAL